MGIGLGLLAGTEYDPSVIKVGDKVRLYFEDRPEDLYYTVKAIADGRADIEATDGEVFSEPVAHLSSAPPLPMTFTGKFRWDMRRRVLADKEFAAEKRSQPGGKRRRTTLENRALFAREAEAAARWRKP